MMIRTKNLMLALTLAAPLVFSAAALSLVMAQEPPKGKEHPEHPAAKPQGGLTNDELADAITGYVKTESMKSGGTLKVEDPVEKKQLDLTLNKVHREKLAQVAPETYFACADFISTDGHTYDLDIFMKGPDKEHLTVTEVSVHKKDGAERYTWHEKDGVWMKQQVGAKGDEHPKGKEHPEHPKAKPPR